MTKFVINPSYENLEAMHINVYGIRYVCFGIGHGEVQNKSIVFMYTNHLSFPDRWFFYIKGGKYYESND